MLDIRHQHGHDVCTANRAVIRQGTGCRLREIGGVHGANAEVTQQCMYAVVEWLTIVRIIRVRVFAMRNQPSSNSARAFCGCVNRVLRRARALNGVCYRWRCRTVFNGNGKLPEELELAVSLGVLVNIDSEFDLENIRAAAHKVLGNSRTAY